MVLCNIVFRKLTMFNVVRNSCAGQSVSGKNIAGILSNRLSDIICQRKLFYSKQSKAQLEAPNPQNGVDPDNKTTTTTTTATDRKKPAFNPRITVISKDSSVTVMSLEEATKLSKRRDLKLVKVVDTDHKTQRPVYKLMTGAEYFEEDLARRKEKSLRKSQDAKDPKLLTLKSNISEHDLGSKINNIVKWLNKKHEVRIVINCGGKEETAELICSKIESETKHCGKMVQKRRKGEDLKFQLLSLKTKESDSKEKSTEGSDAVKEQAET